MAAYYRVPLIWCLVLVALAGGCADDGLDKVVVHGTVTYDGAPLPNGQIRFIPIQGTVGPISGGVIKRGEYTAKGKGGVPVGAHRVEIYSYRPSVRSAGSALHGEGGASEQFLPSKYNGQSTLEVEVTHRSGSEPIDFHLES